MATLPPLEIFALKPFVYHFSTLFIAFDLMGFLNATPLKLMDKPAA